MKRIISLALCFMLVFTLCQPAFAEGATITWTGAVPGENVCEIGGTGYPTLDEALAAVQSGETIRLLEDIDYDGGIVIEDKSIAFDLNGFSLNVVNNANTEIIEEMSGLFVKGNAAVDLEGEGEFNVTGSWYGVFAECDSENEEMASATVTSATGVERDGVAAQSSKVTVKGDVTSNGSTYSGVWASYENAEVTVEGNVYANGEMSMGVYADTLASIEVEGSVIVNGSGSIGIKAGDDGDVTVNGDVSVSGSDSIGVSLLSQEGKASIVTIKGEIIASKYVIIEVGDESEEHDFEYGRFNTEVSEDSKYYTEDFESFVYVSMFAGGSGTSDDPYLIANGTQLYNVGEYYRDGKHFKQIADIDLSGYFSLGEGLQPIGNSEVPFLGIYDGDGYTISNLRINREYQNTIGLFAFIGIGAEIRNVGLIDADVTGRHYVGGLAGRNFGLITNSYVTGEVSGTTYAGGLISYNEGSVTDSYFDGTVSHVKVFDTDTVEYAGGLVGYNYEEGSITGCYADATVQSEGDRIGGLAGCNLGVITDSNAISTVTGGNASTGGLTGYNEGVINNSYAVGDVTGNSCVGGLIGLHMSPHPITDSYFTGTVTASGDYTGGLVGGNYSLSISDCHADDVIVTSTGDYVGGLAGSGPGAIINSYSTGSVTGKSYVGGLVGESYASDGLEEIIASYSTCAVEGEMYVGGLSGSNEACIYGSYAKGSVTDTNEDGITCSYFGGLVGKNTGPIEDSYAWGDVSAHQYSGGLIGYNEADVTNCYVIGNVTGDSFTGGLIGFNLSGAITGSFWNNNTSDQDTSDGGISAGSVAMKQQATYVEEGWNFDTIWGIDPFGYNDGYPFLRWQVQVANVPDAPQNFTATPGDTQVALSWTAPANDGGAAISRYEVSDDNGSTWVTASTSTSHTFTGLTNGTKYAFKVRAVNSAGNGTEASAAAMPVATPAPTYTVTVTNGTGGGEFAQCVTVVITAAPPSDGQRFKEWQVISGGITLVNSKEASTSFQMPANAVEVAATYEEISETSYTVDINSSYAGTTGAGSYAQGVTVTIDAGSRSNYRFSGWTSSEDVTFTNSNSVTTTFIMPAKNMTVTANWTYIGDDDSDDDDSGDSEDSTPAPSETSKTPAYNADVITEGGTETVVPVTVDKDTKMASVNLDSQSPAQGGVNITMPSIPDVDAYCVGIPVPNLSTVDVQGAFAINTEAGGITVLSNMLTGVAVPDGDKAQIIIRRGDKSNLPKDIRDAIGDRPLVRLTLSIDGNQTDWRNPDAPVTVSLPYAPAADELANPESIVVWCIDDSGDATPVPNGRYDPVTGTAIFNTTHFGKYVVAYNSVSFKDVSPGLWYTPAVSFIAAREITTGTGGGNFSPEANLTRGQFIVMLMKAYGIAPDADPKDNFADAGDTYYTGYLAAAKRLRISAGIGNNMFAPDREITRQEVFTLLYNALKAIGRLPGGTAGKPLSAFTDAENIASWAKEAMTLLVKTGTIIGNAGKLRPISATTRAEMAQVLYNLLSK